MENTSIIYQLGKKIIKIVEIGDKPEDREEEKLEHHFLIYMGLFMSFGGII